MATKTRINKSSKGNCEPVNHNKNSASVELPVSLRATELKLYRPYYGCNYEDDYNGENILFVNEKDAWDYIHERCCPDCRKIDNGSGSQCEAEWSVFKYDSCKSK